MKKYYYCHHTLPDDVKVFKVNPALVFHSSLLHYTDEPFFFYRYYFVDKSNCNKSVSSLLKVTINQIDDKWIKRK